MTYPGDSSAGRGLVPAGNTPAMRLSVTAKQAAEGLALENVWIPW